MQRRAVLIIVDIISVLAATYGALMTRFEFTIAFIDQAFIDNLNHCEIFFILAAIVIFWIFRIYSSLWEYAGFEEICSMVIACLLYAAAEVVIVTAMGLHLPRSFYVISALYLLAFVALSRGSYRLIRRQLHRSEANIKSKDRVMIIGAGEAGRNLIREIHTSSFLNKKVCCVIDDDRAKWNRFINGVRVVGDRTQIQKYVQRFHIQQILVAIPSADPREIKAILNLCSETSCKILVVPGTYQFVNEEMSFSKLRPVRIADLLGRDEISVNLEEIMGYVSGKVILVTGGGGSIGSELCRQIAGHNPRQLIILDIYENNAYEIQRELMHDYPALNLVVLIGSVRDNARLESIFREYRPDLVYHAAAHKHVPLMEDSPREAIKNNVLGTYHLVAQADRWNVKKFVMISTDKAVNPTNIMGASKRVCEMIVQMFNKKSETEFVAVRFGNVLGSNGSVIPLFEKQIADGGPVTVTHPDIIRYFMTIPEAVSLVLQAGAYAKGGEIFVLDMGEPVKILDLAKKMIRLSGYEVDRDICIEFTGLRPGEKLYEELLMDEEGMEETPNRMIYIGHPIEMDEQELEEALHMLEEAVKDPDSDMRMMMARVVSTYHPV